MQCGVEEVGYTHNSHSCDKAAVAGAGIPLRTHRFLAFAPSPIARSHSAPRSRKLRQTAIVSVDASRRSGLHALSLARVGVFSFENGIIGHSSSYARLGDFEHSSLSAFPSRRPNVEARVLHHVEPRVVVAGCRCGRPRSFGV